MVRSDKQKYCIHALMHHVCYKLQSIIMFNNYSKSRGTGIHNHKVEVAGMKHFFPHVLVVITGSRSYWTDLVSTLKSLQ